MPRNTILLIGVLALITGILIFLALTTQNLLKQPGTSDQAVVPTQKPVEKTAKVFFAPQNADLSASNTPGAADIMIDTGGQEIAGVQVELQYDSKALTSVTLKEDVSPTSFFGSGATVLFNETDPVTGRISYAVAISPNESAKNGVGKIGTLNFQKSVSSPISTQVVFLDKSLVTILGENDSVLKDTMPLNIILRQATQTSPSTP